LVKLAQHVHRYFLVTHRGTRRHRSVAHTADHLRATKRDHAIRSR